MFEVGIILKLLDGILEAIAGMIFVFVGQGDLLNFARILTQEELSEDPKDLVANYILKLAKNFSADTQFFIIFYLISHGIVKVFLSASLLKRKLWAFPAAIGFFSIFLLYQLYRFFLNYSLLMLLLSIFDIAVIYLTWLEYRKICGKIKT